MTTQLLIVEDDINLGFVLADYLRNKDFLVDTAMDGQEAWEMLKQKHYDLLLLDIMMPKMNGWQLLKTIRESNNPIPVIITSAKTDREDILKSYAYYSIRIYTIGLLSSSHAQLISKASLPLL